MHNSLPRFLALACLGLGLALTSVPAPVHAAEECGGDAGERCYDAERLFDPDADPQARAEAFAAARRAADGGDARAQYYVGTLYRLGMDHPAAQVESDPAKARLYLANAAVHGQVPAMAGMAELHLAAGEPLDGMVWTQAFAHYERVDAELREYPASERQPYAASLVARSFAALAATGPVDENHVGGLFAGFIADRDASIRAGILEEVARGPLGMEFRSKPTVQLRMTRPLELRMGQPGAALYIVGVDREGRIAKALTVDSLPDTDFARGLRRALMRVRFDPDPDAEPLRWAGLPLQFDDQTVSLRRDESP
ncbi:hypothetical protein [Coralloluteibacterium stylophorae]|uniref:TonB C-terminal domain-containing protein n=1 Tax=Coralloluteibacterium stylophorae TaxID=1776034 RepID=A0A8J8AZ87_9GAMM|nr:hypothetical protein [Coralloluteibacterium stylophorae]MBS7456203.1 hypothetical protein [Coralloluteibacterium stylophorae]